MSELKVLTPSAASGARSRTVRGTPNADGQTASMDVAVTGAANPTVNTATIANGASLSGAIDLGGETAVAIQMPAAWTAASITFEVSAAGTTYVPLYWQGSEYTLTAAAASRGISLEPSAFFGWRYVKVRSGTAATPVNQGAERAITVTSRVV